jgi:hypothetical protein
MQREYNSKKRTNKSACPDARLNCTLVRCGSVQHPYDTSGEIASQVGYNLGVGKTQGLQCPCHLGPSASGPISRPFEWHGGHGVVQCIASRTVQ